MQVSDWDTPEEFLYYFPENLYHILSISNPYEIAEAKSTVEGIRPYARVRNICSSIEEHEIRKALLEKLVLRPNVEHEETVISSLSSLDKNGICDVFFLVATGSLGIAPRDDKCGFVTINNCNVSYRLRKFVLSYDKLYVLAKDNVFVDLLQMSRLEFQRVELDADAELDGRDVIKGDRFVIVGLSNDTNIKGSQALLRALSSRYLVVVFATRGKLRSYVKLLSKDLALGDIDELKRTHAIELMEPDGDKVRAAGSSNLYDMLRSLGYEVLNTPGVDMTSLIKISDDTMILSSGNGQEPINVLKDTGFDVVISRNRISEDYLMPIFKAIST